uniref:Uncharacterized protein n=1 Tax=Mycena chlorophos TaxID=658473 RepID=A0ABQ0L0J3_MYCCL|nr:predicted protein [Mycena chlorophos]
MGRRKIYQTEEDRKAAAVQYNRKYDASPRVRATYYKRKRGRKQPVVVIDAPPPIPAIVKDAEFSLPLESPSFRRVVDGSFEPPRIFTYPPPYKPHELCAPSGQRLYATISDLEASVHAYMLETERVMDADMCSTLKEHGATVASRYFSDDIHLFTRVWKGLGRMEQESEDEHEATKAMYTLHRRWNARYIVRIHSLVALHNKDSS